MTATILQPLVGYGFSEAAQDYRLNSDEAALENRVSRSRFWRDSIARAAAESNDQPPRVPTLGPATWTITAPAEAAGEQYHDPDAITARIDALHRAGHRTVSYQNNL